MKIHFYIFSFIFIIGTFSLYAEDFIRDLPGEDLQKFLSPERFQNHDAVIILKEQSFMINDKEIFYRGINLHGKSTMTNKVLIVKLFTESAVQRYGTYEHEYYEWFGDEIPNGIELRVRVLKPDKSVWVMPEDNVQKIVSRKSRSGHPLTRKVIFKIPNLAVGDILQIEESFTEVFTRSYSGLFFYNDKDFIMYSNLYLTFPLKEEVEFLSFPESNIGQPKVEQVSKAFGAGKTYFWSVKNLNPIPDEAYSRPFAEQSLLTAFVVKSIGYHKGGEWQNTIKNFYEDYLEDDDVKADKIEDLGFPENMKDSVITWQDIDQLYTALRKSIVLSGFNSLYPLSEDINSIFETKKGDASDLSYIMYKILQEWNQDVNIVWIRDRRMGRFEFSVPSRLWFDRLGVKVTLNNKSKYYDFDRCIPYQYEMPWFLNPIDIIVIGKDYFKKEHIKQYPRMQDNQSSESHMFTLNDDFLICDSINIQLSGSAAQKFRGKHYTKDSDEIKQSSKNSIEKVCLSKVDTVIINNFFNNKKVNIQLCGQSSVKAENIENNYVISLKNFLLTNFRDDIFSVSRHSDIIFETPFEIIMNWTIKIPEDFKIKSGKLTYQKLQGPANTYSDINYDISDGQLKITTGVHFTQMFISYNQFPALINFLDNTIKNIEQNIVMYQ